MAFKGFGKNSGPGASPRAQTPFGYFPRPPSPNPPPSSPPLQPYPREPEVPGKIHSPPLAFESIHSVVGPSNTFAAVQRPLEFSPNWGDGRKSLISDSNAQTHQRSSASTPFVAFRNSEPGFPDRSVQVQDIKRTRSPPLISSDEDHMRNSRTVTVRHSVSQRAQSPPLSFQNSCHLDDLGSSSEAQRPALPSNLWSNQSKLSGNFAHSLTQQDLPPVSTYIGAYDSARNYQNKQGEVNMPKRTRSPPSPYASTASQEDSLFSGNSSKRPSFSPPRLSTRPNARFDIPDTRNQRWSPPSAHIIDAESAATKPTNPAVPKRTRSPSLVSSDQFFDGNSSAQGESERELQAKAKRLARFKEELSQPEQNNLGIGNQKVPMKRQDRTGETRTLTSEPLDMAGDFRNGNISSDYEAQESSSIIIGLCPDMCPEMERGERERKGDLDQYERLDGDRNQTNESLAVKKYTRTAEREADLIRPMPILQKTLDYLLDLLDQPYDERFLGLYNFLWDRMRAIRMDLRMQHIFNQGAITMLEQMIRLHIIAMHELCEYTKGEGFSEGFDAHLNIEQMNKTSVELFQLYDDHRKKGIDVSTEKEFRGYYALLKLDKHPGYKVEPAELSLDLAKMTSDIRQTPEVVFARDVARACRTGNFIAFFRLARKASYLQACLMHAHFAKLRSQALAALHCGLQNNQGIPVTHVAKWLGMEDEDIENLMEYHGFLIKEYEEPYMVKEGPFLSGDNDYPLKCSKLVHQKKSRRIVDDVSSPSLMEPFTSKKVKELKPDKVYEKESAPVQFSVAKISSPANDDEMPDFEAVSSPKDNMQVKPVLKLPVIDRWRGDHNQTAAVTPLPRDFPFVNSSIKLVEAKRKSAEKPNYDIFTRNSLERNINFDMKSSPLQISPKRGQRQTLPPPLQMHSLVENPVPPAVFAKELEKEDSMGLHEEVETEEVNTSYYDEEVAEAKLKLILRIWRRRSSKRREIREQKQFAAIAALNSLSLGTPIWNDKDLPITSAEFDIDHLMSERYDEHGKSWSKFNVSDVIAAKLTERNPNARCLCWKIILCSQMENPEGNKLEQSRQASCLAASSWLGSKLMPPRASEEDDLVISSPGLAIWKKWVPCRSNDDICCLSVIKDTNVNNTNETVVGASAVLFVVYKCIPWEVQKTHLHNLLMSVPSASRLPLLIVTGSHMDNSDPSTIAKELGLHEVDESRISRHLIVSLVKNQQTEHLDCFFSDEKLREGIRWLASESPLQLILDCIKPRDLILAHLNPSLEVLDQYNGYEVSPNHCISALNEALDQSIKEIATAANSNPTHWPCPEITLLEESSYERKAVDWYLPNIGWSSSARLESLIFAINQCKLPTFPDDISWLFKGSDMGTDTENQRLKLEDCLVKYLSQTSQLMGLSLARKEANAMLQKCARLELRSSTYYIVPKWTMVFRRVFNWRLMNLSTGAFSNAYVLEKCNDSVSSKLGFEGGVSCYLVPPSLDEMVEVGLNPFMHYSEFEAFQPLSTKGDEVGKDGYGSEPKEDKMYFVEDGDLVDETNNNCVSNGIENRSELGVVHSGRKEADRLSKLLEQCNIVQNMNAEKLSVYF